MPFTKNVSNDALHIQVWDQANKPNWKFKKQDKDTDVEKQMCSLREDKTEVKSKTFFFCSALGNQQPIWLGDNKK